MVRWYNIVLTLFKITHFIKVANTVKVDLFAYDSFIKNVSSA